MKYFLIAGEASGDLHASGLMRELALLDPGAEFRFMGGDLMSAVSGGGLVMHYRETSYMMLDVLFHLRKIFRNLRRIRDELERWEPDVVIPVDYPGFNMRIARFARSRGLRVFYFISPKVWAWKQHRVSGLRKFVHALFVILPFEVEYFRKFGMEVEYFGNPLVDRVAEFLDSFEGKRSWKASRGLDGREVVALLAGSRKKEIQAMLPVMIRAAAQHPGYQFVVAGAPSIDPAFYSSFLEASRVRIVYGETYSLLASASAAMVTSGTATLETALFGAPQVVLYRTGTLAYAIAKRMVKINFISLVNLILGRGLLKEVIQKDLFSASAAELSRILEDDAYRQTIVEGYGQLGGMLGERGVSQRIAERMLELIGKEASK
jgi:lipid-A-disaccharide synthase